MLDREKRKKIRRKVVDLLSSWPDNQVTKKQAQKAEKWLTAVAASCCHEQSMKAWETVKILRPFGTYRLADSHFYHPSLTPGFNNGIVVCRFEELSLLQIYFDAACFNPPEITECVKFEELIHNLSISSQAIHALRQAGEIPHKSYGFPMPVWTTEHKLELQITALVTCDLIFHVKAYLFPRLRALKKYMKKLEVFPPVGGYIHHPPMDVHEYKLFPRRHLGSLELPGRFPFLALCNYIFESEYEKILIDFENKLKYIEDEEYIARINKILRKHGKIK